MRSRTVQRDEVAAALVAERLLSAIGAIRRNARKSGHRPRVLSTLTDAQMELVRLVRRRPGVTVNEAALSLRLASNTVSTLVGQLTRAGMLDRRVDPVDRRVVRLQLSPGVKRKVDAWRDRRMSVLSGAIEALAAADREKLVAALGSLDSVADLLEVER